MGTKTVADLLGFDPNAGPKAPNPVAERDIVSLDGAAIIRPDTRRGDREQLTQVTTVSAYTQYTSADQIQTELDANRPVNLQPGIVTLDKPITVSFNNLLRGHPEGTTINYTGTGSYAILFGESGVSLYDCYVSNFKLYGGGIRIDKAGPASAISNVDVYNAPEHGFFFNGATYAGERISLYSCSATGCAGDGLHVVGYDLHGFLANKFTASQNMQHGIYLDASSSAVGNSINNAISNCTVTYNCQDGVTDSEIFIYGYIGNSVVEDTVVRPNTTKPTIGVKLSKRNQSGTVRYPGFTWLKNLTIEYTNTIGNPNPRAVDIDGGNNITLDGVTMTPSSANIYYTSVLSAAFVPINLQTSNPAGSRIIEY